MIRDPLDDQVGDVDRRGNEGAKHLRLLAIDNPKAAFDVRGLPRLGAHDVLAVRGRT